MHIRPLFGLTACVTLAIFTGCNVYDAGLLQQQRASYTDAGTIADPQSEPQPCNAGAGSACDAGASIHCTSAADGCKMESPDGDAIPDREDAGADRDDAMSDQCPSDPDKTLPGACGCGQPDGDMDADGTPDCIDGCPRDPNKVAGRICGCGTSDTDSDGDGTADCIDACPVDADKTSVGACGCGTSDRDEDEDGTVDCVDMCPQDTTKTSAGICGCGTSDRDEDGDGTADCVDMCPQDTTKTFAGICGCGRRDPTSLEHAAVYCTGPSLLHRYRFEGGETFANDSVGDAHARVVAGTADSNAGAVSLSGEIGPDYSGEAFVELPESAWPTGDSATFEAWVLWQGAAASGETAWQRIFDFGDQFAGAGNTYLNLTPDGMGGVRASFSTGRVARQVFVITEAPLTTNVIAHVAVVVDGEASQLHLYVDGRLRGSVRLPDKLSNIVPVNRWLGRSNWDHDPAFFGSIYEFRIFGAALTEAQLIASYSAGPDYEFAE